MTRRDRIVLPVAVFMTACALLSAQAPATPARQKLPGAWRNVGAHAVRGAGWRHAAVPACQHTRSRPYVPGGCSTAKPARC